ncbi:MAG: DUF4062 domain-containing protein [Bacteroidota bacterium]
MSKWTVYISSTFRDLREYRAELINLFENQLNDQFELSTIMERMFDDGTYTPFLDDCIDAVKSSDIYIIILGNKTGSFPPNESRTYTEIELDTALDNDKKIFCLHLDSFNEAEIDNKAIHDRLLDKFRGRPTRTFTNATTLKNALFESLIPFSYQSPVNRENPYKGLAAFDVEDGDYFFGRDAELESCLKEMVTANGGCFLSVVGSSGIGKSSFVRGGLLHRFKYRDELGFSDRKQIIVTPGSKPFTNLRYQLHLQGLSVEDLTGGNSKANEVILFFDQFEEVITQCHSPESEEERQQLFSFLNSLTATQDPNAKALVLCSFRSDFLSQMANYEYIKSQQGLFPLSSLDYRIHAANRVNSISEIICKPALKNGVDVEPELVDLIINQIKEVEGSLPILQFSLQQIWTKETIEDRRITATEFSKITEGRGIAGIIETHAENVFTRITSSGRDKEKEAILKGIFINLVEVNENVNDVKRTIAKQELFFILKQFPNSTVNDVFESLVSENSRLLYVSKGIDETISVSIIHEELLRKWERLKGWIDDRREALQYKKRITTAIRAYHREEGYYDRRQLKRAYNWKAENPDLVDAEIDLFIGASQQQIKTNLLRYTGISISVAALLLLVFFKVIIPYQEEREFLALIEGDISLKQAVRRAGGLDSLRALHVDDANYDIVNGNLKHFKNLRTLALSDIYDLEDLSIFTGTALPLLDTLYLSYNVSLKKISGIENLTNLQCLKIEGNYELSNIKGIESLTSLTALEISSTQYLDSLSEIESLTALQYLAVKENFALPYLPSLEDFDSLLVLDISYNQSLQELPVFEELHTLENLSIGGELNFLNDLSVIANLRNLRSLRISGTAKLSSLSGIRNLPALRSLELYDNDSLARISALENLPTLESLKITENSSLTNLAGIEKLPLLDSLEINGNLLISLSSVDSLPSLTFLKVIGDDLTNLSGVEKFPNLVSLELSYNHNLTNLSGIESVSSLAILKIENSGLHNLSGIEQLPSLASLELSHGFDARGSRICVKDLRSLESLKLTGWRRSSLSCLENLPALKSLEINGSTLLYLSGIDRFSSLTSLKFSGNLYLGTLSGIDQLPALKSLKIDGGSSDSLVGLSNLLTLNSLEISNNHNFRSLSYLENLPSLTFLKLYGTGLTDLSGIEELSSLKLLWLFYNPGLENLQGVESLSALNSFRIIFDNDLDLNALRQMNDLDTLEVITTQVMEIDRIRDENPGVNIVF